MSILAGLEREPHWSDRAACRHTDPVIFHPEMDDDDGDGAAPRRSRGQTWPAKQICAGCPVKRDCLGYALGRQDPHGIWGGLDWLERAALGPAPSDEVITEALAHVGKKVCSQCGREQLIGRFQRIGGGRFRSPCKDCLAAQARAERAERRVAA